jgi:hypothetical protein
MTILDKAVIMWLVKHGKSTSPANIKRQRIKMKVKILRFSIYHSVQDMESALHEFIEDKDIIDIKFTEYKSYFEPEEFRAESICKDTTTSFLILYK